MQAEVLPCFRLPRNKASFTYAVPKEIESQIAIGQFVEIPWRNTAEQGVVTAIHTSHVYKGPTKPILRLLEPTPSLDKQTLGAVFSVAKQYYTSPATLLSLLVPDIPKRQHTSSSTKTITKYIFPDLKVHTSAVNQIKTILNSEEFEVVKLMSESDRLFLYRQACAKHEQIIIIAPTIADAQEITSYLAQYYPQRAVLWDNRMGKNQQWTLWNSIRRNQNSVVIGTRSAILTPLTNPSLIVLDQQGRSEHKQWEGSPYLDTRDLVRVVAKQRGTKLLETAFIPQVSEKSYTTSSRPDAIPAHIMFRSGPGQISHQLKDKLKSSSSNSKLAIVMPSLVQAGVFYCLDCENIWKCPTCHISLRVFSEKLTCSICQHHEPIPTSCSNCRGYKIQPIGLGLTGLKSLLEKDYNASVGIQTASEQELSEINSVILVSPYQLKKAIQLVSGIQQVILFHPEQLLYTPDYKSAFQFYHYVHWHRIMAQLYTQSEFALQTDLPTNHKLLQQVVSDEYDEFLSNELRVRKELNYPPYSQFIGVSFDNEEKVPNLSPEFMGPFKRNQQKKQWLIRQKTQHPLSLDKTLGSFYNKAKIDVNPDQITFIEFKENA